MLAAGATTLTRTTNAAIKLRFAGVVAELATNVDRLTMDSDTAMSVLAAMIDDVASTQYFKRPGPLAWFSLTRTFASGVTKGALTASQCDLVARVHEDFLRLRSARTRFERTQERGELLAALQGVQKSKPKAASRADRSRNQRLSEAVHASTPSGVMHIGHLDEAERVIGELPLIDKVRLWRLVHTARLAYLRCLYTEPIELPGCEESPPATEIE